MPPRFGIGFQGWGLKYNSLMENSTKELIMNIRRASLDDLDNIESLWREMMDFHASLNDYFTLIPEAGIHHEKYMTGLIWIASEATW